MPPLITFFSIPFFRANLWNHVPGSEAVEAAMKLAYQYFAEQTQGTTAETTQRVNFISRRGSWHGCTIAALSVGDIKSRRTIFEPLLLKNVSKVSPCHPWREMRQGESVDQYVARLKDELEDEFQRLGPETVAAFILEPMVGTVSFILYIYPRTFFTYLCRGYVYLFKLWLRKRQEANNLFTLFLAWSIRP
jgi:adenosylmethionine-8-amino-7-oxononanoate aminotransferase